MALALLGQVRNTYGVGALLAVMFFITTPANATLFAAQIDVTPPGLQGRVVSTAMLAAGPVGPPLAGLLLDSAGQAPTFSLFAALAGALTAVMHLSPSIRTMLLLGLVDPFSRHGASRVGAERRRGADGSGAGVSVSGAARNASIM
ncbi:MFS transporter [Streptantibioticus cattleyicolor]|uniref:hypothetical protein n=1 Tax=Streptantibioticus cattleyicolor TaxID=29303 RepID=UPI000213E26F|nr:exported protein of unknown function [Streptantibioticus cattleyicolor NRRL 8057 = DSM 46488]